MLPHQFCTYVPSSELSELISKAVCIISTLALDLGDVQGTDDGVSLEIVGDVGGMIPGTGSDPESTGSPAIPPETDCDWLRC